MSEFFGLHQRPKRDLAFCISPAWERWTGHPPHLKPSRVLARPHQRLAIATAIRGPDEVAPYQSDFKFCLGV